MALFKDEHDTQSEPSLEVHLRGCEVASDVMLTNGKYGIKLQVPMSDGMHEMWFRLVVAGLGGGLRKLQIPEPASSHNC
jgi:hypothetical protein